MQRNGVLATRKLAMVVVGALCGAALVDPIRATALLINPSTVVSSTSPFSGGCGGPNESAGGTNFPNAEVEPRVDVNPTNPSNIVGVWQQDRWSDGGARALLTGVSHDGGATWSRPSPPPFTRCAGGNAANGGDYERATDPWISFAPNGDAYQVSDSLSFSTGASAILVSKSTDGGDTWGPVTTLKRDVKFNVLNDKESVTADPADPNRAYVVWDRLEFPKDQAAPRAGVRALGFRGPTWFSRTTDGGATWEPARIILEPGGNGQTIGSEIVVLPDGTLVNAFDLIFFAKNSHKVRGYNVAVQRSTDHGLTWSAPIIVSKLGPAAVTDPTTGEAVRTQDLFADIAVDHVSGAVYMTWQDGRFGSQSDIAFSKSTDGGRTWSTPARINKTPNGAPAFTPAVAVAADGTIGVTYYDFRNDTPAPGTLPTDYWLVHSHDGGASFTEDHLAGPFDMKTAPVTPDGFFLGDYQGLAAMGNGFLTMFVLTNSANTANRTDVVSATVTP
jgi:hypothetical protein